jgi:hypothetical protein
MQNHDTSFVGCVYSPLQYTCPLLLKMKVRIALKKWKWFCVVLFCVNDDLTIVYFLNVVSFTLTANILLRVKSPWHEVYTYLWTVVKSPWHEVYTYLWTVVLQGSVRVDRLQPGLNLPPDGTTRLAAGPPRLKDPELHACRSHPCNAEVDNNCVFTCTSCIRFCNVSIRVETNVQLLYQSHQHICRHLTL